MSKLFLGRGLPDDGDLRIVPTLWGEQLLRSITTTNRAWEARQEELAWLRKSLEDDHAPDWLIPLVLDQW